MKRKRKKLDVDELNHKIIKSKMKSTLYIPNELDNELLKNPYRKKKK